MASSNNYEPIDYTRPEKVVIVAGPSFGNAMQFVLLGAAIGAGAVYFLTKNSKPPVFTEDEAIAGQNEHASQLAERASSLSKRITNLASRTKEAVQHAGETFAENVKPAIAEAVSVGKSAAHETEVELADEINKPPDEKVADEQA